MSGFDGKNGLLWACLIALVAAVLRLPRLDMRPMHADEAVLADKLGSLLESGSYAYDPNEYHGPLLAHISRIPAYLGGRLSYVSLTESTLRIVPAIAGVALALTPLLLAPALGGTAVVSAALFIAVSPACVYYSRYYIPEMLLALFTAFLLIALWHASRTDSILVWVYVGAAAGAALATKETAVIALAAAAIPFAIFYRPRLTIRNLLVSLAAATLVVTVLLNPALLLQSVYEYWHRGTAASGHAHPARYYFTLLTGIEGIFTEVVLVALAMVSLFIRTPQPFWQFLKVFAILMTAIYSGIPYKTPWCVVSIILAFALLAGLTISTALKRSRTLTIVLVGAGLTHLAWQAWLASHRFAADPRNQWAYAQTTPDVFTILDQVRKYADASPEARKVVITIYTRENLWPLPWYFRDYPNVRWSRDVVIPGPAAPIVIASPDMEPLLQRKFYEGPPPGQRELYMNLFPRDIYLRPGIEVRGYVVKSFWDRV
jgi:uncharacterized protein (TIGR03663 family)